MSTKQIRWIVLSMALGLLGLVGFQLYWISNALHLQKEQFDYKVTDALQEVVSSLERQETQYQVRHRLAAQQQQQQLMAIGKGHNLAVASQPAKHTRMPGQQPTHRRQQAPQTSTMHQLEEGIPGTVTIQMDALQPIQRSLTPEQLRTVDEFYKQQDELIAAGDLEAQLIQQERFGRWIDQVLQSHINEVLRSSSGLVVPDSVSLSTPRSRQQRTYTPSASPLRASKARQKRPDYAAARTAAVPLQTNLSNRPGSGTSVTDQSETIKDIFRGVLMSDRPLTERVNRFMLDTLLREALSERGINIPFDYAVRSQQQGGLLFTSTGLTLGNMPVSSRATLQQQFEESTYKAALFPNNILETGNYVYLFFPDQRAFILSRMTATLAGSAILILVIMGCFYVAITTILRQKKMADIKNDFINNMTHEFKTPISTIGLAVEMARDQLSTSNAPVLVGGGGSSTTTNGLTDRLSRYVSIIRDENQRLGSHVEKVLQMALLDKGEVKLALTPVNVHDVIEKVLNTMSLSIEQRQGELDMDFDATNETVLADEVHLTNMLYNLIDNAIKYSPDHVAIRIRTTNTTLPNGKAAVDIAVADEGLGMTKEQLNRIFETFYRVPTGNRHDVKGFGLGLSYVKKMAEEHQGQITVTSTPGKGSEFQLVIPNVS
ncbi:sensor histidine kinase [Fibrella forsythiae]|uniref:histidine kinase n=1 Tax=Fibrella forsythiae TaxID=2817061 RepID=A0ABS3JGZ9_9BACT|nr:HAMP domain-containing sensor histidine kinase [Fibrella forsythiae]MBO0949282.1 HAMP domain-containing histidine kinase [Fibrella forsythiae]